ncbi:MAG: hypothetical protein J2P30_10760 [Actinobacteria bacterium]|nr:hypothetical protein [Actinomycetota bacterium]
MSSACGWRRAGHGRHRGDRGHHRAGTGAAVYYQSSRAGFLLGVTEYDDGTHVGSALRLVTGVLPYRDFVTVQPPGITLLMTPVALVAKMTSTATGMVIARVLTTAASGASVVLAGLLPVSPLPKGPNLHCITAPVHR